MIYEKSALRLQLALSSRASIKETQRKLSFLRVSFLYQFIVYASLSTGHSNTAADMLSRLETMVLSGAELPLEMVRKQIGSAIDVMVHLNRFRDRRRRVTEISEVVGLDRGEVQLNPLFIWKDHDGDHGGAGGGKLMRTGQPMRRIAKLKAFG